MQKMNRKGKKEHQKKCLLLPKLPTDEKHTLPRAKDWWNDGEPNEII